MVEPLRHCSGQASRHGPSRTGASPLDLRSSWLNHTDPVAREGRLGVMVKVLVLPLVLANKVLEALTRRIPTDVELLERLLIAEAELELVKSENKILRTEITAKVNEIKKRVGE